MDNRRVIRYLAVGIFNTAISYLVYAALLKIGLRFEIANFFACLAGVLVGYRTHSRFVFGDATASKLSWYAVVWLVLYGLNVLLIATFIRLGFDAYLSGALVIPVMVAASYFTNRKFVFRNQA